MKTSALTILITFFLTSLTVNASAQSIAGLITDEQGEVLPYATVLLLTTTDSAMVQGAITNEGGRYTFENLDPGTYRLLVSMVGYETTQTGPFAVWQDLSTELPVIMLKEGTVLDEVTVAATKLLYELKQDRVVMNVGANPTMSGNTGLELLQKTPGVIVDTQNNSIAMNIKGEVLIMINDKIQRVPKGVLMARLEGMRAENIEQIEIIHQPPARYDVGGAAGIIHIVLKKNDAQGVSGNVSLISGYGQREKAGLNMNLNSRKGKLAWYGDYNYNLNRADNYRINHFREYDYQGDFYHYENYVTLQNNLSAQHAANVGLDVDFGNQTVIGLLLGGSKSVQVWGKGAKSISFDYVNDELAGEYNFHLSPKTNVTSLSANLNLFQKIGSGSHINFDLDYAGVEYINSGDIRNDNRSTEETIIFHRNTPMEFWIVSIDNVNELNPTLSLETGIKGTFNAIVSTTSVENPTDENWVGTEFFSGTDNINEQILAGYFSLSKKFSEKFNGELGLRYEHYIYSLESKEGQGLDKAFKNPFPVFRFNYAIDSINSLQLAFNRSITRPSFFQLTSFFLFFDPSLVVYANPRLRPVFTNTFKMTYQHKSAILSLSYLKRLDQLYFYNTVNKEDHLQTSVPMNLDRENIIEANLSFPFSPTNWWEMNWNLNGFYHFVKDESSRPSAFRNSIFTYSFQFNSSFLLTKDWTVSVDSRYLSRFLEGDQEKFLYPYVNLGVRKKFFSGSSLSISFQDITNSIGKKEWEYHQPELGIRTFGNNNFSERQVRVTYTHLFGDKNSGKRKRNTGSEEIKKRMF